MPPAEGDSHTCRSHIHFTSLGHPTVSPLNMLNSSSSKTSCHRLTSRRPEAHVNTACLLAKPFPAILEAQACYPGPTQKFLLGRWGAVTPHRQTGTAQSGCGWEQADMTRTVEEEGINWWLWQNQGCLSQEQWVLRISPSLAPAHT